MRWETLLKVVLFAVLLSLFVTGLIILPFFFAVWEMPGAVNGTRPVFQPVTGAPRVSLAAVGDIMLSRGVGRFIAEYGVDYPVKQVAQRLSQADVTFGNLESPIGTGGRPLPGKGIWFRAQPETVHALVYSGFDVVSVANNHALDYDSEVLLETLDILQENGIHAVGGGENIDRARQPVIIERNGLKIGFLAYSEMADIIWSFRYPRMLRATEEQPGIAPAVSFNVRKISEDVYVRKMLKDVRNLVPKVDLVVVSLHWGVEYRYHPEDYQRELAHRLIDAGVDLIIGHHPHTLQGLERYRQGLIAYSLGNFIFDQDFSQQTSEGLLLDVVFSPLGIERAAVSPVVIDRGQPVVAQGETAERVKKITAELSADFGLDFNRQPGIPVLALDGEGSKI
ncbi:MAG: CapA family protein [Thermoanaerobacteraceae bacterium]|nr:CapA family protein [Thermoanaerobacteraceae bacterium]